MSGKGRVVAVVALAGVAVVGYVAWRATTQTRDKAERAADDIEARFRELDPATRAAVVARLASRARSALPGRS